MPSSYLFTFFKSCNLDKQAEAAQSHNNSSQPGNLGGASVPTHKGHSQSSGSAITLKEVRLQSLTLYIMQS